MLKEYEVLGGYDKTRYTTERIFAEADDGVKVPISLVYKNDFVRSGERPAVLYGYGSYAERVHSATLPCMLYRFHGFGR